MVFAAHRYSFAGSLIRGIRETQEVLDFCAANNIAPDVEITPIQDVNDAYKKVENGECASATSST